MRPKKCVTVEQAQGLQLKWRESRGREIEQAQRYEDTREFWYSLDELQEYLDYVRTKTEEQGLKNPGIRIYFGAYPGSGKERSYSTVFLAPTSSSNEDHMQEEGPQNNYDIDPFNHGNGGIPPTSY
ncbi:hypothetical protein BH23BAC2_BH23BAC2_21080 [soil metagenome]